MLHWSIGIWMVLLAGLWGVLHLLQVHSAHDAFGLIVIVLVLVFTWSKLGMRRQLRPFFLGTSLYLMSSLVDWTGSFLPQDNQWNTLLDRSDDIMRASGIFFMALAFIRLMLERDSLEATLYAQAFRDELTGLGNRRALFEELEGLLQHASGTLLCIDVDHFKSVNDTHGHEAGDRVLKACGQALSSADGSKAFRIGGDEFVLLLGSTEPSVVEAHIAALHAGTSGLSEQYGIALSIGVTRFRPGSVPDPDTALKQADQEMYLAKRQNRQTRRPKTSPPPIKDPSQEQGPRPVQCRPAPI